MSDLLAIIDSELTPEELVAEIIRRHSDRVTLLIEDAGSDPVGAEAVTRSRMLTDRVAALLVAIDAGTGAVVVGLANSREQLRGWRFDRVIGGPFRARVAT